MHFPNKFYKKIKRDGDDFEATTRSGEKTRRFVFYVQFDIGLNSVLRAIQK